MDRQNFLPAFDAQGVGQITPMVQMNIFGKNVKQKPQFGEEGGKNFNVNN